VTHVAIAPNGAHPSYALDYSVRDNDFYVAWDAISRDRASFQIWMDEHIFAAGGLSPLGEHSQWRQP
jgi:glutaconate CoA-transferase, subunit A